MAFDYDPTDTLPASKADLLQFAGAARAAPWANLELNYEPSSAQRTKYYVAPIVSSDVALRRQQDPAQLIIATSGQADASVVSEVWVEYVVRFHTPQASDECPAFQAILNDPFDEVGSQAIISQTNLVEDIAEVYLSLNEFVLRFKQSGNYYVAMSFPSDQHTVSTDEEIGSVLTPPLSATISRTSIQLSASMGAVRYFFQGTFTASQGNTLFMNLGSANTVSTARVTVFRVGPGFVLSDV